LSITSQTIFHSSGFMWVIAQMEPPLVHPELTE